MKHDYLAWAALAVPLVVTASAEYALARAAGFGQWTADALPAALDIYAVRALRAHRDVLAAVAAMIATNAAAHLVVAVSAIAPSSCCACIGSPTTFRPSPSSRSRPR
ncbi:hypothetical protein [Streptomyces nodosus]|uniref:hypothetical protein n=1 Tax=Streptomyces nodosus TaxID=40318 RepID=UPI00380BAAD4